MLDGEHFLHFNRAGDVLNGKIVSLNIKLQHLALRELEGRTGGFYVNRC